MPLSVDERTRYQRHLALSEIGAAGQEKLKAARVLVVGAGGLGSPAALYLAAAGCGTLGLLDCDRVELSNLQRQVLFDTAAVAQPKALAGRERLSALNPDIRIIAHDVELKAANVRSLLSGYDVVLDGSDRLATRYLLNDACVLAGLPLVSAAIHRFEGQLFTYRPGGPCYRCIFPEAPDGLVANCAEAGVLGVLPGVLGTLQATEAIKLITGVGATLTGRLLLYDALDMRFGELRTRRRSDCPVCGANPTIREPKDIQAMPSDSSQGVRRLSAADLNELLHGGAKPLLVDVREDEEFAAGHLPGSLHIPLGELPARLAEIPKGAAPVFICRSGGRSLNACLLALRADIASPANLEGGLRAWAASIDPSLTVI
ncbi:MAG TPA: molybdopterin-synthase adenylyltransferase MoeB [Steroidobacteraceae bacterium]|jgi:adenylyltransferase/sulfurtransferase|nr:molybdopterin-synthase adenylyltransferase MoeB [Steroidobacteraceae bacterium]